MAWDEEGVTRLRSPLHSRPSALLGWEHGVRSDLGRCGYKGAEPTKAPTESTGQVTAAGECWVAGGWGWAKFAEKKRKEERKKKAEKEDNHARRQGVSGSRASGAA